MCTNGKMHLSMHKNLRVILDPLNEHILNKKKMNHKLYTKIKK